MPPIKKLGRKIFKNRSTRDVKRNTKQHPHAPSPIVGEEYVCYEIEKVINSKPGDCGSLYLVKWAGYGSEYNSWIPELPSFFQKYNKAIFTDDEESDLDDEESECESDFEPDEVEDSSEDNMSDSSDSVIRIRRMSWSHVRRLVGRMMTRTMTTNQQRRRQRRR